MICGLCQNTESYYLLDKKIRFLSFEIKNPTKLLVGFFYYKILLSLNRNYAFQMDIVRRRTDHYFKIAGFNNRFHLSIYQ